MEIERHSDVGDQSQKLRTDRSDVKVCYTVSASENRHSSTEEHWFARRSGSIPGADVCYGFPRSCFCDDFLFIFIVFIVCLYLSSKKAVMCES